MVSFNFEKRTAVVTGGGQGIGAATAAVLASGGARVFIADRDYDLAVARASEVSGTEAVSRAGGSAVGIRCDVGDEAEVDRAFREIGHVDILVNNAGITRDDLIFRLDSSDWDEVIRVNLRGTYLCCRAAQRSMVAARFGRIVSVSSRSALGSRGQANYSAAKAGIQGLTATLAIELGPFNVNVNAVAPGYIATPMTERTAHRLGFKEASDYEKQVAERTPLGRVGQPEDVANVIAFLASENAAYVSGQTLYVNGGAR